MIGVILTLFLYNFVFYLISLVVYLIVVNKSGKSENTANTISTIISIAIIFTIYRLKGIIYPKLLKLYEYLNGNEEQNKSSNEAIELTSSFNNPLIQVNRIDGREK